VRFLRQNGSPITAIAWSPDGTTLTAGTEDGVIHFWKLPEGAEGTPIRAEEAVEALAFSPDGGFLAASREGGMVAVRELETGTEDRRQPHEIGARGLAWTSEGRLVSAGWDGKVNRWNAALTIPGGGVKMSMPSARDLPRPATCLCATAPGSTLFVLGTNGAGVLFLDTADGVLTTAAQTDLPVFAVAAAGTMEEDGLELRWLAFGDAAGAVHIQGQEESTPKDRYAVLTGHTWTVYGAGFTPDGNRLATCSADGTVRLWDVPGKRELAALRHGKAAVLALAVAPDGMTVATGSEDGSVVLWDLADV